MYSTFNPTLIRNGECVAFSLYIYVNQYKRQKEFWKEFCSTVYTQSRLYIMYKNCLLNTKCNVGTDEKACTMLLSKTVL